jgi:hypothetical protein
MSYLVCDKCGGHYELQSGEKAEDFDLVCECGGKIEYKESIQLDNEFKDMGKEFNDLDNTSSIWKRVISISSGAIIIIIISVLLNLEIVRFWILNSGSPLFLAYFLTLVFAGGLVVLITRGNYRDGIYNCAAAGLIGGTMASIFNGYMPSSFGYFLILMSFLFSFLGGLIVIVMIKLIE